MSATTTPDASLYPKFIRALEQEILELNGVWKGIELGRYSPQDLKISSEGIEKIASFALANFCQATTWGLLEISRELKYLSGPFCNSTGKRQEEEKAKVFEAIQRLNKVRGDLQPIDEKNIGRESFVRLVEKVSTLEEQVRKLKDKIADLEEKKVDERASKRGWFF